MGSCGTVPLRRPRSTHRSIAFVLPTRSASGVDGGFTVFVWNQLYLGIEAGVLIGSTPTKTIVTRFDTLLGATRTDVLIVHGGVPVGYRVPLGDYASFLAR